MEEPPTDVVARILAHAASRAPTLGTGRLVSVDGPAGAGKTTLAAGLAAATGAPVVHMDDLYEGWDGLPGVDRQLARLLRPLAEGRPGRYRRYDWHLARWAEWVRVPVSELLVLEGVGAGAGSVGDLVTTLVFVDAPHEVRMRRGLARDGEAFAPHWAAWAAAEEVRFAADRTRQRADLLVDGATGRPL